MDFNEVTLVVNLGQEPAIKQFDNGGKVCNLSVATSRKWKTGGDKQEKTEWNKVVIRDEKLIESVVPMLQSGTRVLIKGRLETRSYDKDGQAHYITEVIVPKFEGKLIIQARGKGWSDNGGEIPTDTPF